MNTAGRPYEPVGADRQAAGPRVEVVDTTSSPAWREFVKGWDSDLFHSPAWHRVLRDTYGFEPRGYVLTGADGRIAAGVAACPIDDLRGSRLVSMPFSDHCDPLVADPRHWRLLEEELRGSGVPVRIRSLRNRVPVEAGGFEQRSRARWHGLDLGPDLERLWAGLHPSARGKVRQAEKAGVKVSVARGPDELRGFFELHLGVRKRKYGLLAQPYRFFENVWREFMDAGQGALLLATAGDRLLAGTVLLVWRDRLYYKFSASAPGTLGVRPNDLLMWNVIRYGKERGLGLLDFGLSDWDQAGLVDFKRKFASSEGEIAFLERGPAGKVPDGRAAGELLHGLTALFTREEVPDLVTEEAGDLLYRFFA